MILLESRSCALARVLGFCTISTLVSAISPTWMRNADEQNGVDAGQALDVDLGGVRRRDELAPSSVTRYGKPGNAAKTSDCKGDEGIPLARAKDMPYRLMRRAAVPFVWTELYKWMVVGPSPRMVSRELLVPTTSMRSLRPWPSLPEGVRVRVRVLSTQLQSSFM